MERYEKKTKKKQVTITLSNIKHNSQYNPVHLNILYLLKFHLITLTLDFVGKYFFYCITEYQLQNKSGIQHSTVQQRVSQLFQIIQVWM